MPVGQEQIEESLSLVLADVVAVPLGKSEQALVEHNGQRLDHVARDGLALLDGGRVDAAEAEEVEDERVDDLVRKRILLLQESLDKDVGSATTFGAL